MDSERSVRPNLSNIALLHLREKIINGSLTPQEKLVESDIARELGISRGPVRDALKQLAVEGLVEYQPNKGCSVALLSPKDAYEVFFLRGNLELISLRHCQGVLSQEALDTMEQALRDMETAVSSDDTMASIAADELFHLQIARAAGVEMLTKMWLQLSPLNGAMFLSVKKANESDLGQESPSSSYAPRGQLVKAHRIIYDAIRAKDLVHSSIALEEHYLGVGRRVHRTLDSFVR